MKISIKAFIYSAFLCCALLLSPAGCSRKQSEHPVAPPTSVSGNLVDASKAPESDHQRVLSRTTTLVEAGDYAVDFETPFPKLLFSKSGNSVAYVAKKAGSYYIVLNGKAGSPCPEIDHLSISPDGLQEAHSCRNGKRRIILNGNPGMPYGDVWYPVFSPDSRHIAYIAQTEDRLSHIVVDDHISDGRPSYDMDPVFSADSSKVIYVERGFQNHPSRLVVRDLTLKKSIMAQDCIGPTAVINKDRTRVAAAVPMGKKQRVLEFDLSGQEVGDEGPLYDIVYDMIVIGDDGTSLAYPAKRGDKYYLVLNNREALLPEGDLRQKPVIRPDNRALGVLMLTKDGYYFTEVFSGKKGKSRHYQGASDLVYSRDSKRHAFITHRGTRFHMIVNGAEGPAFDAIVTPEFSPDGKYLIYRARQDGRRFMVVADGKDGRTVKRDPPYDEVFDPEFIGQGEAIAYGARDGDKLIWKVTKLGK